MQTAPLTWMRHELTVPGSSPLRSLALGGAALAPTALAPLTIEIPDLSAWPTPAQKIELLLAKAAEVEHALLVQYLYAAYSLKQSATVTDPLEQADLAAWRLQIAQIAQEEMGHLMTVQNLKLLVGLPPSFERSDFPMVSGLFPFETTLQPLSQRALAEYVVAESPGDVTGIDDIMTLAMGSSAAKVNHVGVLYGLIGVVLARDYTEIKEDAKNGDSWYGMVLHLADLAYQQNPRASGWHLPDTAFDAMSMTRQGTVSDWPSSDAMFQILALKTRQDAKDAIRDIGIQGEGVSLPVDVASHFGRFLAMYRGNPHGNPPTRPFPAPGGWVPTLDVPSNPRVADSADPSSISHPTTQPWAKLANLRYAILLGLLEEYLAADPVVDRAFLVSTALHEMRVNLRRLAVKLVTLPRAATGTSVAALPFELPTANFPLPADPTARRQVHAGRFHDAIALEGQIIASEGGVFDALLSTMQTADEQSAKHFLNSISPVPAPGGHPMAHAVTTTTTTHWPAVKKILDDLIADWTRANANSPPNLTGQRTHQNATFGWATKDQLINSAPLKFQLIAPHVSGANSNLVKALTTGVGGKAQMPDGGPYLTDPNPKYKGQLQYIIDWIDEGMPD